MKRKPAFLIGAVAALLTFGSLVSVFGFRHHHPHSGYRNHHHPGCHSQPKGASDNHQGKEKSILPQNNQR